MTDRQEWRVATQHSRVKQAVLITLCSRKLCSSVEKVSRKDLGAKPDPIRTLPAAVAAPPLVREASLKPLRSSKPVCWGWCASKERTPAAPPLPPLLLRWWLCGEEQTVQQRVVLEVFLRLHQTLDVKSRRRKGAARRLE